jgi:hypothetical protein
MQSVDERVRATVELTASKSGGHAQASSIFIMKFPIMPFDRKCRVWIHFEIIFALPWPNAAMKASEV